jgi:GNAT superfamily N-acetyltransferase
MDATIRLAPILRLEPLEGAIEAMRAEARSEGHQLLDRLVEEWRSGVNRFALPGERLLGAVAADRLVAIGGLNRDPWVGDPSVGRLRRLYVAADRRGEGVGRLLVEALLADAREAFGEVRLRTGSPDAARFYLRLGFSAFDDPQSTHRIAL